MSATAQSRVQRVASASVTTRWGVFDCVAYRDLVDGHEHLAFVHDPDGSDKSIPPIVRLHSECITGDVFGSSRCDCGEQLAIAMTIAGAAERGVVIYMRGHEGRGIGAAEKIRAYALQDQGRDTVEANLELGFEADSRDFTAAAGMLLDMHMPEVRLLTNNPEKQRQIEAHGITVVERVSAQIEPTPANLKYLRTKRDRLGHILDIES
jgi:3,4-dihydroxy 2-butanone 4-phosphate synthase / GTP cyclohydrolase II